MMASSSSSFFGIEPLDGGDEPCRHALDGCSLCGKRFAGDCDIFMYRGDTPFCSEECRHDQMVRDDFGAGGDNTRLTTERPPTRKEERRQRRRHHQHQAPAAAEPARVPLQANVPVAI